MQNEELAEKLHKPINRTFEKSTLIFYRKIGGPDHADMELISKFNKGFRFLLFVIDIYSKYAWVFPLNDKKSTTITIFFQKVNEYNQEPNKTWVDKGHEFYNRWLKSFLQKNDIEMYSTHNEGKCVIAERFIRFLKNKIYK